MAVSKVKLLIDTSAYSAFNRGDGRLREYFRPDSQVLVPLVVVGELRAGFALGNRPKENEALLQKFLDMPNVNTVTISDKTTKLFAAIFKKLKQQGTPINTKDMWIAALTLEHDCLLVSLDSDFDRVPELAVAKI